MIKTLDQINSLLNNLYFQYQKNLNNKTVGVLVSGGIDSSLIAYFTSKYFKKITLLTITHPESEDINFVKILNAKLKQTLVTVSYTPKKLQEIKDKVVPILKNNHLDPNPTQISLASAFFLLLEKAKEFNIEMIFTGQGPDVLLAGYHMYQKIKLNNLNKKIREDLPLLEIDKKRDSAIANYFGIKLINPYLEKPFIDLCLEIPAKYKINQINNETYEKFILRKLGEKLKLPNEIILRHKKAIQYSTKIRKFINS